MNNSSLRSQVKTYTPPPMSDTPHSSPSSSVASTTPVVSIYTKPHLMRRLKQFLDHFDRPPQQLFIDFAFVEVEENDVSQFRYKLQHPILQSIYGPTVDEQLPLYQNESTSSSARLPTSLTPRL
ncbi:hypothetical protein FDP41_008728 [Naegleria fowleri]|uniref:Uncharacterized protein n=1 Tax=Naegleria fowleri TaxID=5763 RepID=A0A6A5BG99_NAEFO|nr:uncharacterized protein FDP41_008728 [Naegleria fowleri]KAF0973064.1 hypothetical protein FDP41_008728 [Naegleria fowleri]CAG4713171.1 unnamed protein product [Naegleria fowleri]